MAEALIYGVAVALFVFVVCATAFVRHEIAIMACIPPVFVAFVTGFAMWVHLYGLGGLGAGIVALLPGYPAARYLARRFPPRDLIIAIYLAWAVGMVVALVGFSFPDPPEAQPGATPTGFIPALHPGRVARNIAPTTTGRLEQ